MSVENGPKIMLHDIHRRSPREIDLNNIRDLLSTFVLTLALINFSDIPDDEVGQVHDDFLCGEDYEF